MNFQENIRQALRSVRSNLLRSILTLLIIAFGIMALVGILSTLDGIKAAMTENFTSMGANTFNIIRKGTGIGSGGGRRGRRNRGPVVTYDQAMNFKERYDFGGQVSVHLYANGNSTIKKDDKSTNPNITVYGADENYFTASGYDLDIGRNFTKNEVLNGRQVAVVGKDIASTLKLTKKNIEDGVTILVGSMKYRVVGQLAEKGSSGSFSGDKMVFIPLLSAKRFYASQKTNYNISVIVQNPIEMEAGIDEAIGTFRQVRGLRVTEADDFEIDKSDSLVEMLEENLSLIKAATIVIGVITLLGAAIGLMNIMLVSITERTREIGICKALGATRKNILLQFLIEAMVICQMGGLIGILLGILMGSGVSMAMGAGFFIPWRWIIFGIVVCVLVGGLSGIYPAMKASRMDPIESLRYE